MKINWKRIPVILFIAIIGIFTLIGCANKDKSNTNKSNAILSGSITMAGSTSMEKFATALSEAFMKENSKVTINAEYIGSSAGIESLITGNVQIGNASRPLKDSELEAGVVENIVAIDGIAVVTNPNNKVTNLSTEELAKIYKGEISNWEELGGDDLPIVVVGREAGSGTRGAFEELLGIEEQCDYANEFDSTGAVKAKAASTKGAIGYVSFDVLDDTVNTFTLNGVAPNEETIQSGEYVLRRPFIMATTGEINSQSPEIQALFDYIKSDKGQALIESVGLFTAE